MAKIEALARPAGASEMRSALASCCLIAAGNCVPFVVRECHDRELRIRQFNRRWFLAWSDRSRCLGPNGSDSGGPIGSVAFLERRPGQAIHHRLRRARDEARRRRLRSAEQRIATFDNDGTLWCEQPVYFPGRLRLRSRQGAGAATSGVEHDGAVQAVLDKRHQGAGRRRRRVCSRS